SIRTARALDRSYGTPHCSTPDELGIESCIAVDRHDSVHAFVAVLPYRDLPATVIQAVNLVESILVGRPILPSRSFLVNARHIGVLEGRLSRLRHFGHHARLRVRSRRKHIGATHDEYATCDRKVHEGPWVVVTIVGCQIGAPL